MTVNISELEQLIIKAFPNSNQVKVIDTVGDGNHLEATIVSSDFENKSSVQRHKMVYDALGRIVGREIHALSLIVKTPQENGNTQQPNTAPLHKPSATDDHSFANNTPSDINPSNSILTKIDQAVKNNNVVLFMKGDKEMPMCGFSGLAVQVLDLLGVDFEGVNVLSSEELREGIKEYSNWPTIPQLYIKGKFIGGADIIREMYGNGQLANAFTQAGITVTTN